MPTVLSVHPNEQGTLILEYTFKDEDDVPSTPNTGLTWSLYKRVNKVATVVNSRLAVPIASASTVTIVLSGDDLALTAGESKTRYVLFSGAYNSSLGSNLPIRDEVAFSIRDLVGVS